MSEVHLKLLALAGNYDGVVTPLVCHIDEGASGLHVPSSYQHYSGVEPIDDWFEEIVSWWQSRDRGRAASFNHGERLYAFGFERQNQIRVMVKALKKDPHTTRALATLVYPIRDARAKDFPSFTTIQLLIRDNKLNVVAYYRKQEMPHWWPVNVAELARIQKEVLENLNSKGISVGSITTITAKPTSGISLPRVAVPWVDREADAGKLPLLVVPLLTGNRVESALTDWGRVFSDWVPNANSESADGNPTPLIGIDELIVEIDRLSGHFDRIPPGVQDLRLALRHINVANAAYRGEKIDWREWADTVRPSVDRALDGVARALQAE